MCRTMFSRTTMASSMSRPMDSESAISVIVFSVIPRKYMMMKEEMTEIGRVRPVMTVERQEFRKQNPSILDKVNPDDQKQVT